MIEIVIKIEEETYNRIMNGWMPLHKAVNLMENVQKGTPLPKGHGRLIDADKLDVGAVFDDYGNREGYKYVGEYELNNAPTIIESDEGENNEVSD